jgi:membrane-bound lytic murein transglycosylase A
MLAMRLRTALRFTLALGFAFDLTAAAVGQAAASEAMKLPNANVEPVSFSALAGWTDDDQAAAFASFRKSCGAILAGSKAMREARSIYGALYKVCERAAATGALDTAQARAFFERNFRPVRVAPLGESDGFFTGYYETVIEGARVKSAQYSVPLYARPADLAGRNGNFGRIVGGRMVPYYDRTEIENGALAGQHLEICWVKNPVDAFFAQIQGSTRVHLSDGKLLRLNYAATNGLPYTPVGKFLVERGIIAKQDMSMDRIRDWMDANPAEAKDLRRKNRAFVFFQKTELSANDETVGAQGVPLTPLRSVAVDKNIHVYGTPIWIDAELPIKSEKPDTPFRHLAVAQDTGTAIVGPARADIYFGSGEEIGHVAGRIKQHGTFVMLVPSAVTINASAEP